MIPQVGQVVKVVCRNIGTHKPVFVPSWNDWTPSSPETVTYVGVVVKRDYWLKDDEFNMTSKDKRFPIRTIRMTNVVSINGEDVDSASGDKVETRIVKGSKGNVYTVVIRNGVAESCTCPGYRFHNGRCKHLKMV